MNYAAAWFLVSMAGQQWIGPLPQPACQMAAATLRAEGVVCKQAATMNACAVPNQPGTFTACPHFDFPQVTIKGPK